LSDHISRPNILQVGIDIGGTFTDFVVYQPTTGELDTFKLLSTPADPSQAVLRGLTQIYTRQHSAAGPLQTAIIHGSTIATNALLERKGARMAFIATRGFGDLLQIGRQNRPELYDLFADPPPALAQPGLRYEVDERVTSSAEILQGLDPLQVAALIPVLRAAQVESLAVCLLFSFLRPEHEQTLARMLRAAGFFVSVSSEILPEFREYERASTTAVNAYVSPALDRYLGYLESAVANIPADDSVSTSHPTTLRIMQSNGGQISPAEARRQGVHCILSGPAGGVIGANHVAALSSLAQGENQAIRLITFDMGGTSTDVSLIDGQPQVTREAIIGGCPICIPLLDIHTIGAGGGSLARLDAGGALQVGPQSAGADPGPACYGRGDQPTVTDANLLLGRLVPDYFLGGQMPLDLERARLALQRLGNELGLSAEQAALGIIEVVNAHMERAMRLVSVERGHDPRRFTLLSFGGAGGLHAADLARRLGMPRLIIPPLASTLSAFGMLAAQAIKDYSQTVMLPGDTPRQTLAAVLAPLAQRGLHDLQSEGFSAEAIHLEQAADLRYLGQSYELSVPIDPLDEDTTHLLAAFHTQHQRLYGYSRPQAPVEVVTLRLRAVGRVQPPGLQRLPLPLPAQSQHHLRCARLFSHPAHSAYPVTAASLCVLGNTLAALL
jgi:N-methylhydantoinase A